MARYIAWVDGEECLDTECQAVGNASWDTRVIYCSTRCFLADGHTTTPTDGDDSHEQLWGFEPDSCEHCGSCEAKVVQGINCTCECDAECIAMEDQNNRSTSYTREENTNMATVHMGTNGTGGATRCGRWIDNPEAVTQALTRVTCKACARVMGHTPIQPEREENTNMADHNAEAAPRPVWDTAAFWEEIFTQSPDGRQERILRIGPYRIAEVNGGWAALEDGADPQLEHLQYPTLQAAVDYCVGAAQTYHYHDTARIHSTHSPECFDLTRSEVDASLEHESDEFGSWIRSNPAVGDTFIGQGNDVAVVERIR
jgi:hypothetical protein